MQAAAPLVFDEFYQSSNDILDAPWRQEPLALLLDRIDGLASRECPRARRQLLERQIALLGDISMGRFWQEAFPGETPARQGVFEALFSALRSAARRGPGRITWGLRFPLAVGAHVLPTVVFWVQMVEAILEDRHWRAHYFWHDGDESLPGSLTLFFRPPAASLFLWLMPDTVAHSGLFDLRQVMNERSDVSCPPELARLLRDDEVSMLDLLYRAGRREVLL
jgi:type VI secretion system protein ImpM